MATKKSPAVHEQKPYSKEGLADFLAKAAAAAPANVKRSKTQILIEDHGDVLKQLKSKGYSAKQIAELVSESGFGLEVSEAAVRAAFTHFAGAAPAKAADNTGFIAAAKQIIADGKQPTPVKK